MPTRRPAHWLTCHGVGLLLHELPPLREVWTDATHGLERPDVVLDHPLRDRPLKFHHTLEHLRS